MAGAVGKSKGAIAAINITPLVDVVLVLLIIFMLVVKGDPKYVPNVIPKKADADESVAIASEQLVLELLKDGKTLLNRTEVSFKEFPEMFRKIMDQRTDKNLFIAADDEVPYREVIAWMSRARQSGATMVALQVKPPDYQTTSN